MVHGHGWGLGVKDGVGGRGIRWRGGGGGGGLEAWLVIKDWGCGQAVVIKPTSLWSQQGAPSQQLTAHADNEWYA